MLRRYYGQLFRRILVPIVHGSEYRTALAVASAIAGSENVLLSGIVGMPEDQSLSTATAAARHLRKILREATGRNQIHAVQRIRVSHNPWDELVEIVNEEEPDLLVLQDSHFQALNISPNEALRYPPCDMVVASGSISEKLSRVLVSLRGGPYAELSLRLGLSLARTSRVNVTALHLRSRADKSSETDAAFKGIERVLKNLPQVKREFVRTENPVETILDKCRHYDLVVLGATAQSPESPISIGPVAEGVLKDNSKGVLIVKAKRPVSVDLAAESAGQRAISVLVDKWFAENTYHAGEFSTLEHLLDLKRQQDLTISLALPALNEEETVGKVITTIKTSLMQKVPLLDEIILIDSNSEDRTREIAARLDIPVHIHQNVLRRFGTRSGKGEALWKSLYLTHGDIVLWIDTDIVNIHPRFVYGILGPLILRPDIQLVKGFYRRPLKVDGKLQAGGGGRVTELTARPLLNLFYPELSGLIQPLSGEYGGRRSALEQIPFSSGYGVEISMIIDIFEKFGLSSIAQVDLQERIHHNQPLESLSKMSFAIIQSVVRRLEKRYAGNILEDVNKTMKLIRYEQGRLFLDLVEIAELERPAMAGIPEYQKRQITN
jgi:nucleotide-binding universal stress UspA family protein